MLRRWLSQGLDPAQVTVITRSGRGAPEGVRSLTALPIDETPATLMLGFKPQQLDDIAPTLSHLNPKLLLSILAGVEEAALATRIPAGATVRMMPNLPVAIGQGVTALFTRSTDAEIRAHAQSLAEALGLAPWIEDEARFDAVTALAGCGPAFVFRFIDAIAQAGVALGLDAELAQRLALATVDGAGSMAIGADASPGTLADRVASPGGSTREGLNVLDADDGLNTLMAATLAASERRNREMAAAARR
ncbi:pyrroline-5-carboxylate reductase [Sphingomonas paucimobilis]|jgi:pyrroline-5-carboxylate reductase|nr:pyrroline-5-carboxylate reductase [Sphingomonas paucimobilis]MCM3679333.1 pyrroline-5-carboxylate reductase [Sphingomonas paucimobilis]BCI69942.1 pyrroline-5-carboxylate reductase [Sphingomonas paucimobilis]GAN12740.1 pyrroline-5-carboxylate reductase [Sphingomonas paucimobilis NBRC 13935]